MYSLLADLRYALRALRRAPGFTAAAVATIAIGVGAVAAIYGVVDGVVLRPLPYADAGRLVRLWESAPRRNREFASPSPANFLDWRRDARGSFAAMAAYAAEEETGLTGPDGPQRVVTTRVAPDLFPLLGVAPRLGRGFLAEEGEPGGDRARAVVLGHALWVRAFGADAGVVGRTITLGGEPRTVVGVMPPGFAVPRNDAELWLPLAFTAEERTAARDRRYLRVLARLAPGATLDGARREMAALARRLEGDFPDANAGFGVILRPLVDVVIAPELRRSLLVLLGATGLVLLIACANVANLLLARGAARGRELAVRAALGASAGRIVRQLLTESLLLALLGAAAGVLLATAAVELLVAYGPADVPRLSEVRVDARVLGVAMLAALTTGALFGIAPAWRAARPELRGALTTRGDTGGGPRQRLRGALVVAQVALAVTLLAGAALLLRGFARLQGVSPGFDPRGAVAVRLSLPEAAYGDPARRRAFYAALVERAASTPGVRAAGAVSSLPMRGGNPGRSFLIEGRTPASGEETPGADLRAITPDYFAAMRIPLAAGRAFRASDDPSVPGVVIVSEALARRFWPGERAAEVVGHRIGDSPAGPWSTIVGVVSDVLHFGLDAEPRPTLYVPHAQRPSAAMTLVARAADGADPARLVPALRAAVRALDPNQPLGEAIARARGGRVGGAAALPHGAARGVRGRRGAAGVGRALRRAGLRGGAARPRAGRAAGPRRDAGGGARARRQAGDGAHRRGAGGRAGGGAGALAHARRPSLRRQRLRPGGARRGGAAVRVRRAAGHVAPGAARGAGGPDGGDAGGLEPFSTPSREAEPRRTGGCAPGGARVGPAPLRAGHG
ncbi:MAG TPA: ABC transporter permease [Gemmatimonadaceae bacterium]|nr:ABC transporter permease [Gemmatimonadaceae bacterium]